MSTGHSSRRFCIFLLVHEFMKLQRTVIILRKREDVILWFMLSSSSILTPQPHLSSDKSRTNREEKRHHRYYLFASLSLSTPSSYVLVSCTSKTVRSNCFVAIMFTDSIKTFGIFLVFTTVIQCFSYTLDLSEHHPRSNLHSRNSVESEFSRRNQISETETPNSLNSSPSSTWVGWNWKTQAPPPSFPTRKSVGRSSGR